MSISWKSLGSFVISDKRLWNRRPVLFAVCGGTVGRRLIFERASASEVQSNMPHCLCVGSTVLYVPSGLKYEILVSECVFLIY